MTHVPVLLAEILSALELGPGLTVLDATVNRGGHSRAIGEILGQKGTLVGLDRDGDAIREAGVNLASLSCRVVLRERNYRELDLVLAEEKIPTIDRALFDLGLSSHQLDMSGRGFTFQKDEPLLMTFESEQSKERTTASEVVNSWSEETLADVIYGYGGEQFSRRIAKAIVERRGVSPLKTTFELAELVKGAVPPWYARKRIHPATKTFQAIRIAVNDELGAVREGIEKAWNALTPGGIIGVISFHELEDRIVKNYFRRLEKDGEGISEPRKGYVPTKEEVLINPRSRSARLRICKKK